MRIPTKMSLVFREWPGTGLYSLPDRENICATVQIIEDIYAMVWIAVMVGVYVLG